jgi:hemerythrin-like domain-containing protein
MITIGKTPEVVADEPLEHLVACHDRILDRLATLERIADALETDAPAALSALRNTLRFFDVSGRLHTEDEEQSIFPRLRSRLSPEQIQYLDSLEAQHREKEQVYEALKHLADQLAAEVTPERIGKYRELAFRFAALYRPHIASENDLLVRLGDEALTPAELAEIRSEMKARRGR